MTDREINEANCKRRTRKTIGLQSERQIESQTYIEKGLKKDKGKTTMIIMT